jgi:hypothetical protein
MNSPVDWWVIVTLKNGDILIGFPVKFNVDYEQGPAMLLKDSSWIKRDGIEVDDSLEHRSLLIYFDDIKIMEFFT